MADDTDYFGSTGKSENAVHPDDMIRQAAAQAEMILVVLEKMAPKIARVTRTLYNAYLEVGFSKEEAIRLTTTQIKQQ